MLLWSLRAHFPVIPKAYSPPGVGFTFSLVSLMIAKCEQQFQISQLKPREQREIVISSIDSVFYNAI